MRGGVHRTPDKQCRMPLRATALSSIGTENRKKLKIQRVSQARGRRGGGVVRDRRVRERERGEGDQAYAPFGAGR